MTWWPEMRRSRGCRASCVWSSRTLWGSRAWCGVRGNPGRCAVSDSFRPRSPGRPANRHDRRSFLKGRGRSRPLVALFWFFSVVVWARRSRRRGQGSGVARPRSGRRALTPTLVGARYSRRGRVWVCAPDVLVVLGGRDAHQGRCPRLVAGGSRCGHSFAAGVVGGMMGCAVLGSAGSIRRGDHAGWGS